MRPPVSGMPAMHPELLRLVRSRRRRCVAVHCPNLGSPTRKQGALMTTIMTDVQSSPVPVGHAAAATAEPLTPEELRKTHAYWRACNYLAAGMIYLRDNPLLREPLKPEHIKNRLLGHWGSSPGLSLSLI